MGAFNTIGSIIGTFVPTFVTIPAVGTSITFLIFAGILLVLSAVYFISVHTGTKKIVVSAVIFVICCGLGYSDSFAFWEKDLTYESESVYNYLQVSEDDREVILSTNVLLGVQSVYMKQDRLTGMYYDYAMAAPLMVEDKDISDMDVLILGMGTGTYATQCRKYLGDMNVEGVEIDEKITQLSRQYFSLPEDIQVTMNMRGSKEGNINQYLSDTIGSVFNTVYTVDVAGSTNRELFASDNANIINALTEHAGKMENAEFQNMMNVVAANSTEYVSGDYILTDDKAPVELLGMQVIDELIKDEVAYYKEIYAREGIRGLLNSI